MMAGAGLVVDLGVVCELWWVEVGIEGIPGSLQVFQHPSAASYTQMRALHSIWMGRRGGVVLHALLVLSS
jgi:hypothetical protein